MKNTIYFLLSVCSFLVISCASPANEAETNASNESENVIVELVDDWQTFWTSFQTAVASKDVEAVEKLCVWSDEFDENSFMDSYEMYFNPTMRAFIAKNPAAEVTETEDAPMENATEKRTLQLLETGEADGEIYESALMLYFGKKGEGYGLIGWMAVG
jgi:hypothetical protein